MISYTLVIAVIVVMFTTIMIKKRRNSRKLKIVQIGCGVLGKSMMRFLQKHDIVGLDLKDDVFLGKRIYSITEELPRFYDIDIIYISVPTNLKLNGEGISMDLIFETLNSCVKVCQDSDPLIIIRSTIATGVVDVFKQEMENECKKEIHVCYQPEFLRERFAISDTQNPRKLIFGTDSASTKKKIKNVMKYIYQKKLTFLSTEEAEVTKLVHNGFNTVKITYGNAMYTLYGKSVDMGKVLGIVSETSEASYNRMYGFDPKRLGYGAGGKCLPKDLQQMLEEAKKYCNGTTLVLVCDYLMTIIAINEAMKIW